MIEVRGERSDDRGQMGEVEMRYRRERSEWRYWRGYVKREICKVRYQREM